MDTRIALILFLIDITLLRGQEYFSESLDGANFNPNEFMETPEIDTRHVLRALDSQSQVSRIIKSPSKYCRTFGTCFECVKSMWYPCVWCHDFGCTDQGDRVCPVTKDYSIPRNLSSCPYIHNKRPILLASGVRKHIQVKINVPDPSLTDKDLLCQIKLKNQMRHFRGVIDIENHLVHCFPVKLMIVEGTDIGSFSVVWGGVEPVSNEVPLMVYRCDSMANDCEDCKRLPTEYGCGWCEDTQMCTLSDKCNDLVTWSLNRLSCQFQKKQMYFI